MSDHQHSGTAEAPTQHQQKPSNPRLTVSMLVLATIGLGVQFSQSLLLGKIGVLTYVGYAAIAFVSAFAYVWNQVHASSLTKRVRAHFDEANVLETYQPRARTLGHLFQPGPPTPAPAVRTFEDQPTETHTEQEKSDFAALRDQHYGNMFEHAMKMQKEFEAEQKAFEAQQRKEAAALGGKYFLAKMTIAYHWDVSSASLFAFFRLLFRWRGSIWRAVLRELLTWLIAYLVVSFFFRTPYFLSAEQKRSFEKVANYMDAHLKTINLTFILGFFVTNVTKRWTDLLKSMGNVESLALFVGSYIRGEDEETRVLRRTVVRFACLAQLLVYRDISVRVRNCYPTMESVIEAGFMLKHEQEKLESIDLDYDKYWVPINWASQHVVDARKSGKITNDPMMIKLSDELRAFRINLQTLCTYDWVPIPLIYPQVISVSVYFYFVICLISRQFITTELNSSNKSRMDIIIPVMTMIQFIFYVGWTKVAMGLLNPLGEDDDDIETTYLVEKNLAAGLCIVDEASKDAPELIEDPLLEKDATTPLYPPDGSPLGHPLIGSAAKASVAKKMSIISLFSGGGAENDRKMSRPGRKTTKAFRWPVNTPGNRARALEQLRNSLRRYRKRSDEMQSEEELENLPEVKVFPRPERLPEITEHHRK